MSKSIGLIGAPTSAGAFAPGQEDAPAALRDAGLVPRLRAAGVDVVDLGDTPRFRWRPDPHDRFAMNAGAVRAAALAVAEHVSAALERDLLPLVIGGDCTVELGTVLGWQRQRHAIALVYFDPHPDLNTPDTAPDGAFDWMGIAHLRRGRRADGHRDQSAPRRAGLLDAATLPRSVRAGARALRPLRHTFLRA